MRLITLTFAALAFAAPAAAQDDGGLTPEMMEIFDRGCGDDRGNDRCSPDKQSEMHALYRIESPAALLESRTQMRRAMFVDGYGNDLLSVTFLRAPGEGPRVSVAGPPAMLFDPAEELSSPISIDVWNRVIERSEHFDRDLVPEDAGDTMTMCLHGSFTVVEAVDPARRPPNIVMTAISSGAEITEIEPDLIPGSIRVDAEGACANGLAVPYAYELAELAFDNLLQCATLDPDDFRGNFDLFRACQRLGGDRLAAGEAATLVRALRGIGTDRFEENPEYLFAGYSNGKAAQFIEALDGGSLGLDMPHATDVDHATIEGFVGYFEESGETPEIAPITLNVARIAYDWVIVGYEIGEREALDLATLE